MTIIFLLALVTDIIEKSFTFEVDLRFFGLKYVNICVVDLLTA